MRSWLRATKGSLCTVTVHAQCHTYAYCCGTNLVFFLLAKHPLAERHSRSIGEACLNGKHPNIIRCMLTREREPWLCDTTFPVGQLVATQRCHRYRHHWRLHPGTSEAAMEGGGGPTLLFLMQHTSRSKPPWFHLCLDA